MHVWRWPVSIEAINWALNKAPIPTDRKDASSLASVLIGLANHADPDGRNAFPSVDRLTRYTRLSERTVRTSLDRLEELKLITPASQTVVAAHVPRGDRRPKNWNLALHRVQPPHPADQHGVQSPPNEVQGLPSRGAATAPETSFNHQKKHPSREHAPEGARAVDPCGQCGQCGQCDARPTDPISARIVWLDAERSRSTLCLRCHPSTRTEGNR
jgi:hypothetical protein